MHIDSSCPNGNQDVDVIHLDSNSEVLGTGNNDSLRTAKVSR